MFLKWLFETEKDKSRFQESDLFMFYNFAPKVDLLENCLNNINGEDLYIIQPKSINKKIFQYIDVLNEHGISVLLFYPLNGSNSLDYEKICLLTRTFCLKKTAFFWNISDLNIFLGYFYTVLQINSNKTLIEPGVTAIVSALEGLQHTKNISNLSEKMSLRLGFSPDAARQVALAGAIHDVGKIFIPSSILNKKGRLTVSERKVMGFHTIWGAYLIKMFKFFSPKFKDIAAKVCAFHHERIDGTGYPYNLKGEEIPLEAQIVAIADVYDALVNNRPYRSAVDKDLALSYLKANQDKFGRENVQIFLEVLESD